MALTVPSNVGAFPISGYTTMYEYGGPPTLRIATISKSACDFRNDDPSGANGPLMSTGGVQATISWNVLSGAQVNLQPGQTYYFNFKNYNCNSNCPAAIETLFPH